MIELKKIGRIAGLLFLLIMITWGIGFGLIYPTLTATDFLNEIFANQASIKIGVLFELIEVALVLGLTFILYPLLKQKSELLAIAYFGFRVFECMMLVVAAMMALILISTSVEFAKAGAIAPAYLESLGSLFIDIRWNRSMFILSFFHPMAAIPMYLFLYNARLVPRWISGWGFLSALLLMIDQVVLESFGLSFIRVSGNPITGLLMGANEIVIGVWLLIKGFNTETDVHAG
jgi:hypothetical protein